MKKIVLTLFVISLFTNIAYSDFADIVEETIKNTVLINVEINGTEMYGTGIILGRIDKQIYILTNYHVINFIKDKRLTDYQKSLIKVTFHDYTKLDGFITWIGNDDLDLAILMVNEPDDVNIKFNDVLLAEEPPRLGDEVFTIGNPQGLSFTVTKGIVSAFRQTFTSSFIQTDLAINPGNSGGGLFTKDGRLVGIIAYKGEGEGIGYALYVGDDNVKNLFRDYELKDHIAPSAHLDLANRYLKNKQYDLTISELHKVLSIKQNDDTTHYKVACIYSELKDWYQAIETLNKAVKLGFNFWDKLQTDTALDFLKTHNHGKHITGNIGLFLSSAILPNIADYDNNPEYYPHSFVEITINNKIYQSKLSENILEPVWNQSFFLDIKKNSKIIIRLITVEIPEDINNKEFCDVELEFTFSDGLIRQNETVNGCSVDFIGNIMILKQNEVQLIFAIEESQGEIHEIDNFFNEHNTEFPIERAG